MENLTRFNNLRYNYFKVNFKGLVFEVKLLDDKATFPNIDNKDVCEEFKINISRTPTSGTKEKSISFKFYNSIMEREISEHLKLNLLQYPKGTLKIKEFKGFMRRKMWGGYDEVKNLKQLTEKRIYFLLYSVINSLSMDRTTETDSFKFFCDNFGYDEDSRKAEKIFKAVQEQKEKIESLNLTEEQIKYLDEEANQETDKFSEDVLKAIQEVKQD